MIEIKNITKKYEKTVLNQVSYTFEKNKIYVIKGVSGCGKTTLLNIIGVLENSYEGEYFFNDKNVGDMSKKQREQVRQSFGYIFQSSLLMSHLTVLDNLLYIKNDRELILKFARQLGVELLLEKYPEQLSGGERQRISVIRTLILQPEVILADEPTASLDKVNSEEIAQLFATLRNKDRVIIIATHENCFDELADEIIHLDYGVIGEVEKKRNEHKEQGDKEEEIISEKGEATKKGNSYKVLIPLIFRRHREKFKINALLPLTFVIVALLICFSIQHNFYDETVKYCKKQYPMEMFSIENFFYEDVLRIQYDNVQKFDLYILESDGYVCYPLLNREDSVLAYGGLIKYGSFPEDEYDVLISYKTASHMKGEDNIKSCIGEMLNIGDVEYTVTGVVADLENDATIESDVYYGNCYYKAADNINVYIPYETISRFGKRMDISLDESVMVKVSGLYNDQNLYQEIKEACVGDGSLSVWDSKLSEMLNMLQNVNKIISATFAVAAFMSILFIKNDIEVDLFYRRKELGYLQIFGVKKRNVRAQLILERMAKNIVALCFAVAVFNVVAIIVKLVSEISIFVSSKHILILLLAVVGFSLTSVMLPIWKFLRKSVLSLITE